jgi:integrase
MSEIQGIRVGKINFENRTIWIDETWERIYGFKKQMKTERSERLVTFSPKLERHLKIVVLGREGPQDVVFLGRREGHPVLHTEIDKHFRVACATVGINREDRRITFHGWRHFWDSCLLNAGVPTPTVMRYLGHATERMTLDTYYHLEKDKLNEIRKLQEDIL